METLTIAQTASNALKEKKASDVVVIDIREISTVADYFVIATGNNPNQMSAMQDEVEEKLQKMGIHPRQIEGNQHSTWILMDYQDVVIHLFSKEDRQFYDLDRIWSDGKRIE